MTVIQCFTFTNTHSLGENIVFNFMMLWPSVELSLDIKSNVVLLLVLWCTVCGPKCHDVAFYFWLHLLICVFLFGNLCFWTLESSFLSLSVSLFTWGILGSHKHTPVATQLPFRVDDRSSKTEDGLPLLRFSWEFSSVLWEGLWMFDRVMKMLNCKNVRKWKMF